MEVTGMHLRIWPLVVSLAVLVGCAGPAPEQEAAPAGGESMAAPEATPEAAPEGALAGEGFESGRSENLETVEEPTPAAQGE
jgi:hypothetical protein